MKYFPTKKMRKFTLTIFRVIIFPTLSIFSCDSIDKLRNKLPSLDKEIQDMSRFKEFYQFTFNYAKNPCQKGLDLDMAIAYWNIVLKGKFKFLDIWTKFLKVSYYLDLSLFEVQQFYSFFGIQFMQIEIFFFIIFAGEP